MDFKPWSESKTLAVNALSLVAAVLTAILGNEWVASYPRVAAGLTAGLAAVNMLLRFVTSLPLGPATPPTIEPPRL